MLKQLPWPRHLERVPDIAANHHEKNGRHGLSAPPAGRGAAPDRAGDGGGRRVRGVDGRGPSLQAAQNAVRIPAHHGGHVQERHLDTELYLYFLRRPHLAGLRAAAHEPVADRRRGTSKRWRASPRADPPLSSPVLKPAIRPPAACAAAAGWPASGQGMKEAGQPGRCAPALRCPRRRSATGSCAAARKPARCGCAGNTDRARCRGAAPCT
ncbi:hypothetical protein PVZ87_20525 [Bordetella pertussis]|nr:hypothetical protein PVZ87_20525 [Bordetella pertussis]